MARDPSDGGRKRAGWHYQASLFNDHISREALAIESCRGRMDSIGVPNFPIVVAVSGYQDRGFPWCPVGVHVR